MNQRIEIGFEVRKFGLCAEDSIKDRKKSSRRYEESGDNGITIEMIVETLEESIRVFWHFVKADKDSAITTMKGQKGVHPDVQNAEDLELFMDVMKSLRKVIKKWNFCHDQTLIIMSKSYF